MRVHFLLRDFWETMVILEGENLPHQRFPRCGMLVPWRPLNGSHLAIAQCVRGEEQKRGCLAEEEVRENLERAFQDYGEPLDNVMAFRYIGMLVTAVDDYWPAVVGNFHKARKKCTQLSRIMSREGGDPKVSGYLSRR